MILASHLQVHLLLELEPNPELAEASPKSLRDRVLLLQLLNVETNRKEMPREGKETLEAELEPEMNRDWQCQWERESRGSRGEQAPNRRVARPMRREPEEVPRESPARTTSVIWWMDIPIHSGMR